MGRRDVFYVGALLMALLVVVGMTRPRDATVPASELGDSTPSSQAAPEESTSQSGRSARLRPAMSTDGFAQLPVGGGGFVTGLSFSDDGVTRMARTDGYGGYRWSDVQDRWVLSVSADSLPAADVAPGVGEGGLALAVAPSDHTRAYLAFNDAIYRSDDAGRSWSRVLSGVPTAPNDNFRTSGPRLVVDPADPEVVFYGSQLDGMFITRDGGTAWSEVSTEQVPAGVLVDIDDPATRGDVNRRTNLLDKAGPKLAGAGINAIAIDRSPAAVDPDTGRSQTIYAASYGHGIYASTDAGRSWTKISPPQIGSVGFMSVLANGQVLATAHENPVDLKGPSTLWRYDPTAGPAQGWSTTGPTLASNWQALAVDPTTPGRVAAMGTGGRLALSLDNGATWLITRRTQTSEGDVPWLAWALNGGDNYMSVGEIAFDPVRPGRLWFAEGTGVWHTDLDSDDLTLPGNPSVLWHAQTRGIEQLVSTDIIAPRGGKPVVSAWDRPIFRIDDLTSYADHYGPVNRFSSAWSLDWSLTNPDYLVASVASHQGTGDPTNSGYSTDGGDTWTGFPTIPENSTDATNTFGFGTIAVSAPGNIVWAPSYGHRPQYTLDGGTTWNPITLPGLADYSQINPQPYYVIHDTLTADKTTPGTFYLFVNGAGTYRTTDGGTTWTLQSDQSALDTVARTDWRWNASLQTVPDHPGELYLTPGRLSGTTSQTFYHSTDTGRTWQRVENMTGVTAFGLGAPAPGTSNPTLYAAGYLNNTYGIYRSTDNATTWTLLTTYPAGRTTEITTIAADPTTYGRLYLANAGGNGWTYGDTAQTEQRRGAGDG